MVEDSCSIITIHEYRSLKERDRERESTLRGSIEHGCFSNLINVNAEFLETTLAWRLIVDKIDAVSHGGVFEFNWSEINNSRESWQISHQCLRLSLSNSGINKTQNRISPTWRGLLTTVVLFIFDEGSFNKHRGVYTNLFYPSRLLYTVSTTTTTTQNHNNNDNNDDDDDDDERGERKTIYGYLCFWNKMFISLMMRQQ